jgi:GyrI-like small molecule binding domain
MIKNSVGGVIAGPFDLQLIQDPTASPTLRPWHMRLGRAACCWPLGPVVDVDLGVAAEHNAEGDAMVEIAVAGDVPNGVPEPLRGPPRGGWHRDPRRWRPARTSRRGADPRSARRAAAQAEPAAVTVHTGRYEDLAPRMTHLITWVHSHGFRPAGSHWENYLSDPTTEPNPAAWQTEVVLPYRQ